MKVFLQSHQKEHPIRASENGRSKMDLGGGLRAPLLYLKILENGVSNTMYLFLPFFQKPTYSWS